MSYNQYSMQGSENKQTIWDIYNNTKKKTGEVQTTHSATEPRLSLNNANCRISLHNETQTQKGINRQSNDELIENRCTQWGNQPMMEQRWRYKKQEITQADFSCLHRNHSAWGESHDMTSSYLLTCKTIWVIKCVLYL